MLEGAFVYTIFESILTNISISISDNKYFRISFQRSDQRVDQSQTPVVVETMC